MCENDLSETAIFHMLAAHLFLQFLNSGLKVQITTANRRTLPENTK